MTGMTEVAILTILGKNVLFLIFINFQIRLDQNSPLHET